LIGKKKKKTKQYVRKGNGRRGEGGEGTTNEKRKHLTFKPGEKRHGIQAGCWKKKKGERKGLQHGSYGGATKKQHDSKKVGLVIGGIL